MNVHQTITGALNRSESAFALGSVEGINFTACAVGCDVVILAADFARVQILPGDSAQEIACIDCCSDTGKIAAGFGCEIGIFEPTALSRPSAPHGLDYRWFKTATLSAKGPLQHLSWNLEGLRLLGNDGSGLELWEATAPATAFHVGEPQGWESVWTTRLPTPIAALKFSPDGSVFATAAKDDTVLRIWYPEAVGSGAVSFTHLSLCHPRPVVGLEWRHTGRYMPRHSVANTLISWAEDNVARLWVETAFPGDTMGPESEVVGGAKGKEEGKGKAKRKGHSLGAKNIKDKISGRLRHLQRVREKNRARKEERLKPEGIPRSRSPSLLSFDGSCADPCHFPAVLHFHLAGTINPETDCFLVPSMAGAAASAATFAVHWLNNKELVFSKGVEALLSNMLAEHSKTHHSALSNGHGHEDEAEAASVDGASECTGGADGVLSTSTTLESRMSHESWAKDEVDWRVEHLLRQWNRSTDVLFTIHPLDASLLVWTVEWLDDGSRGASISFSSRLPSAFPLSDASSLCHNHLLTLYPHHPAFVHHLHPGLSPAPQPGASIFLLSNHSNGSLNLWDVELEDASRFTTILNLSHRSRMCGHRFRIDRVISHPVLPLLLTTGHNRKLAPSPLSSGGGHASELILWKVTPVGPLCKTGGVRELSRINAKAAQAFSDVAWIPATLPPSALGSVCDSPSSCFVASDGTSLRLYQAVLDAQALLSELSFSAGKAGGKAFDSDSESSAPNSPVKASPSAAHALRVVSNQSSARPGCILELQTMTEGTQGFEEILFLHVYPEHLLLGDSCCRPPHEAQSSEEEKPSSSSSAFHERFFVVMIEKRKATREAVVHTWLLDIAAQPPAPHSAAEEGGMPAYPPPPLPPDSLVEGRSNFYPSAPKPPPPSMAQLFIRSKKVCTQPLDLGDDVTGKVELLKACPAAGHLPSANLHSACQVPYLLLTTGTDEAVRMWRCERDLLSGAFAWAQWGLIGRNGRDGGAVEAESRVLSFAAAQTTRFAAAFNPKRWKTEGGEERLSIDVGVWECESTGGTQWVREDTLAIRDVPVPKEAPLRPEDFDTGNLPKSPLQNVIQGLQKSESMRFLSRIPSIQSCSQLNMLRVVSDQQLARPSVDSPASGSVSWMVCVDWVSTEDGAHILTVGVGAKILLYALASDDAAQTNLVMMKETAETHKRGRLQKGSSIAAATQRRQRLVRWQLLRTVELNASEGEPSVPTMLSWVRDGILVVGMESEMRVYNQWSLAGGVQPSASLSSAASSTPAPTAAPSVVPTFVLSGDESAATLAEREEEPGPLAPLAASHLSVATKLTLTISPSHSALDLARKARDGSTTPSATKGKSVPGVKESRERGERGEKEGVTVAEIIREEGVFEAARLASPALPQYHPKQLMELLNEGKIRRVKAILMHILRCMMERNVGLGGGGLGKGGAGGGSFRRRGGSNGSDEPDGSSRPRSLSTVGLGGGGEEVVDYEEIESIPPLPLHALVAADSATDSATSKASGGKDAGKGDQGQEAYDGLFTEGGSGGGGRVTVELDLGDDDEEDEEDEDKPRGRQRRASVSSTTSNKGSRAFSAKHCRLLTRYLTHVHLPGLSSVDQMHLLAVADTLASFSPDVMDKLTSANASLAQSSAKGGVVESSAGAGYASAGAGVETVDECGLRFLMAMKQHQYLLRCLPMGERVALAQKGLSTCHVAWALQSETETELLNSIPALQKESPSWASLRALGVGWWLQDIAKLRTCVEKMAKAAFQKKQDPMDAALFYLAMRKKNVLTHLFKSVSDKRMADFFREDFELDKWKKAALKNAFVLMGKQRFEHAVAFFLLGGSLPDAIQTCLAKLQDIQLAMVVVRLFESEPVEQGRILSELLCKEVLGIAPAELGLAEEDVAEHAELEVSSTAHADPFLRSMAYWRLKQYAKAAATLLDELRDEGVSEAGPAQSPAELSAIFNFYAFLRCHPLVIRQRLDASGVQIASTEKFIMVGRELASRITPQERRLYFRAATGHFQSGCPLLALDVLSRLPKRLSLVMPGSDTMSSVVSALGGGAKVDSRRASDAAASGVVNDAFDWGAPVASEPVKPPVVDSGPMDWGSSLIGNGVAPKRPAMEELELKWSDEEAEGEEEGLDSTAQSPLNGHKEETPIDREGGANATSAPEPEPSPAKAGPLDTMSQQLKFVACLRILMEELGTLATGFEVDGGVLRCELYRWLEQEVETLKLLCDYSASPAPSEALHDLGGEDEGAGDGEPLALHEALREDRADMRSRWEWSHRRRAWLKAHAGLLRTFASYSALHGSYGVGLASARMELLLLMLELQQEDGGWDGPLPAPSTFPLLTASVASQRSDLAEPIRFLQGQCKDLLEAVAELSRPPSLASSLSRVHLLYNLGQCLSACLYESLSDIERAPPSSGKSGGFLLRRRRRLTSCVDEAVAVTAPAKWPGVQSMVALLSREAEESGRKLQLLLLESFSAVYLALFAYAFTAYDARWLYRLMAHPLDGLMFASVFGGGGEVKSGAVPTNPASAHRPPPPPRPPRPPPPRDASPAARSIPIPDPSNIRAKFNAKVFGSGPTVAGGTSPGARKGSIGGVSAPAPASAHYKWVPPKKSLVAFFSAKPVQGPKDSLGLAYDSDDSVEEDSDDEEAEASEAVGEVPEHLNPDGYAWSLIRLAMLRHVVARLHAVVALTGLEAAEVPVACPRLSACLRTLAAWEETLSSRLDSWDGGCPLSFLPHSEVASGAPSLHKYRTILEPSNTPFEAGGASSLPVKRLWLHLVRQEGLMELFIRYIFKSAKAQGQASRAEGPGGGELEEPLKIVQREQDPIAAFAVSNVNAGWIVVATARELQEMDVSPLLKPTNNNRLPGWMSDAAELDIALASLKKDPLRDNDDYLLLSGQEAGGRDSRLGPAPPASTSFMTPFVVDRSRKALHKLAKRSVGGIRRMAAHPVLPYYATGGSDGSVRMWEWGTGQPLCEPRPAGQFAKVSSLHFTEQGSKLGVTDRDGILSLWLVGGGINIRKPFFHQQVHHKNASDFAWVGGTSSLAATVGVSEGGHNLALWDTLMPTGKNCVGSFVCHSEGGTVVCYSHPSQTIVSGGRHGELLLWDLRQRQLRYSVKAFDHSAVKSAVLEGDTLVLGSADGDLRIYSMGSSGMPALIQSLPGQHSAKGGFTLRNVATDPVKGVQCIGLDQSGRLFTCGADASLKLRQLPTHLQS